MRSFTVHLPSIAEKTPALLLPGLLVEERFSCWGFWFGPLWLLRHRVWWWGAAGLAIVVLAPWPLALGVHLLCGLCGPDARRGALARRGFRLEAVVLGRNADAALLRLLTMRPALAGWFRA